MDNTLNPCLWPATPYQRPPLAPGAEMLIRLCTIYFCTLGMHLVIWGRGPKANPVGVISPGIPPPVPISMGGFEDFPSKNRRFLSEELKIFSRRI